MLIEIRATTGCFLCPNLFCFLLGQAIEALQELSRKPGPGGRVQSPGCGFESLWTHASILQRVRKDKPRSLRRGPSGRRIVDVLLGVAVEARTGTGGPAPAPSPSQFRIDAVTIGSIRRTGLASHATLSCEALECWRPEEYTHGRGDVPTCYLDRSCQPIPELP